MNTKTLLGKTASNGIPLSILRIVIHFQMKRMEFPTYQIFKCLTFLGSVSVNAPLEKQSRVETRERVAAAREQAEQSKTMLTHTIES